MHLSDLLHSRVVDAAGADLGSVEDVRMVQDGPLLLPFGAAFRIEGLMVGRRSISTRIGFVRGGLRGPWLIRVLLGALERGDRYVEWTDVEQWDGTIVRLTKRHDELAALPA